VRVHAGPFQKEVMSTTLIPVKGPPQCSPILIKINKNKTSLNPKTRTKKDTKKTKLNPETKTRNEKEEDADYQQNHETSHTLWCKQPGGINVAHSL
jgi:hypothetical protein